MSQQDCNRHHRHNRSSSRGCQCREKQNETGQIKSQCELVNKIASIDIWATERLYNKWRRQAIAQRRSPNKAVERSVTYGNNSTQKSCLKHGGIAIGSGSKYFKARLVDARNPKLQTSKILDDRGYSGGDSLQSRFGCKRVQPHELRRSMKLERLKEENRLRKIQRQQYLGLSGSSEITLHSHCHCHMRHNQMQKESHELSSSKNDTLEGSNSSSQTPAPKSGQQTESSDSGELQIMRADTEENLPRQSSKTRRTKKPMDIKRLHKLRFNNRPVDSRPNQAKHKEDTPKTIEAFVTIESMEPADTITRHQDSVRNLTCNSQKRWNGDDNESKSTSYNSQSDHVERQGNPMRAPSGCQWSNSSTRPASRQRKRSLSSDRIVNMQLGRRSIDQSTYNIVKSISCSPIETQPKRAKANKHKSTDTLSYSYNIAGICKTEHCPLERACKLPKPTVYLMTERSTTKVLFSSDNDYGTVLVNKTGFNNRTHTTSRLDKRKTDSFRRKANQNVPSWASQRMPAKALTGNNSVDGKSLLMLPPTTDECETNTQNSESLCPALVSKVQSLSSINVARTYVPEVKMQSNATAAKDSVDDLSEEDLESLVIQTEQETGELSGIEPKTGSVTRRVQNAVLEAAGLLAAKGFAGLVGFRRSEKEEEEENEDAETWDTSTWDSLETAEDGENKKIVFPSIGTSEEETSQTVENQLPAVQQNKNTRKSKVKIGKRDNKERDSESLPEQRRKGENTSSKKLLPMTACPTTQHRVECYRTRSGRVKCYMTARHPVKCQVRGGRIVCKATLNPQASDLPYPCNAAWQCY